MSTRTVAPLLVAATTMASAWPLHTLFEGRLWWTRTALMLALLAGTSIVARAARVLPVRVMLLQFAVYTLGLSSLFGDETTLFGLPTPSTVAHWADVLSKAGHTIGSHPAPVPETPGTVFLLVGALAAAGLAAETVALPLRQPALAGLLLFTPFLLAVANADAALSPRYFVAMAAGWIALLAVTGPGSDAPPLSGAPGAPGVTARGLRVRRARATVGATTLAAAGLAISLGGAAALPHLPIHYLADGLGGTRRVGFNPTAQMLADLQDTDGAPVLRYRTDDPTPPPLRIAVSRDYMAGTWQPQRIGLAPSSSPSLSLPAGWQPHVVATRHRLDVEDNRLSAPHLAAPAGVVAGTVIDARWAQDQNSGILIVAPSPTRYTMTYLSLLPTPAQLRSAPPPPEDVLAETSYLLDGSLVTPAIEATARRVTAGAPTAYDKALAIQDWLRSRGGFTYSLDLDPPPAGMTAEAAADTAVDRFLESKRGYCVQFASAMILMARSQGIPARMATGFLPGTLRDGYREVTPSDAHAWPELYFSGAGWLRFEPTPGARSGLPPDYTVRAGALELPTARPTGLPSTRPTAARPTPTPNRTSAPHPQGRVEAPSALLGWPIRIGLPMLLLLAAALAFPSQLVRRRRAAELARLPAGPDRAEARWQHLLADLADLDIDVEPAHTLSAHREYIASAAELDAEARAALHRLVRAVQDARYAPAEAWATGGTDVPGFPGRPETVRQGSAESTESARQTPGHATSASATTTTATLPRPAPTREPASDKQADSREDQVAGDAVTVLAAARASAPAMGRLRTRVLPRAAWRELIAWPRRTAARLRR